MRYLLLFFVMVGFCLRGSAQTAQLDSIFQRVSAEKDDATIVCLVASNIIVITDANPEYTIPVGQKLLGLSKKKNSRALEALAFATLGQGYRLIGNYVRALSFHQKAWVLAQETQIPTLMAYSRNQTAHIYKDREENEKAIGLYKEALQYAGQSDCAAVQLWPLFNLGAVYLTADKPDSALMYIQRAYERVVGMKTPRYLPNIYLTLANVHSKLKNEALSLSYYRSGLEKAAVVGSKRYFSMLYAGLGAHYRNTGRMDSAAYYSRKGIAAVQGTPLFFLQAKPAKLLADMYEKQNCDSSLKYARFFKSITDSLMGSHVSQQIQLMTFEEDARQLELDKARAEEEQHRQQNIEYALLALGITVLLMAYLILSRSFITNVRLIESAGVLCLLLVFEFLNLLLHPFLEGITHHSPVLMLLALVGIAALLVPLHHRIEKWAISSLVSKNKAIRLAAAKKTLDELGG